MIGEANKFGDPGLVYVDGFGVAQVVCQDIEWSTGPVLVEYDVFNCLVRDSSVGDKNFVGFQFNQGAILTV